MTLPLLRGICRWAAGRFPVHVMLGSTQHFELIREENLNVSPIYYKFGSRLRQSINLRDILKTGVDLVVGVPGISAKKLSLLGIALRARYTAGEVFELSDNRYLTFPTPGGWTKSILQINQTTAAALGIDAPLGYPFITLTQEEESWARTTLSAEGFAARRPLVGVHCSSIMPSKRWPPEYFAQVISRLKDSFATLGVVSFASESERPETDEVRERTAQTPWLDGVGRWTIRQTAAMLAHCDVLLSGDTGLMHIAAAVGTRTVSVFGPTSTERLAPTYNRGFALHPNTPCHPCLRRTWTPCDCIRTISPERVQHAVRLCLGSKESIPFADESCARCG